MCTARAFAEPSQRQFLKLLVVGRRKPRGVTHSRTRGSERLEDGGVREGLFQALLVTVSNSDSDSSGNLADLPEKEWILEEREPLEVND